MIINQFITNDCQEQKKCRIFEVNFKDINILIKKIKDVVKNSQIIIINDIWNLTKLEFLELFMPNKLANSAITSQTDNTFEIKRKNSMFQIYNGLEKMN